MQEKILHNTVETVAKILSVAVGGAFGAAVRYLINISPLQNFLAPFPFPTFFINVLGSFLIGFLLITFTEKILINETLRLLLMVGFLGAFTTFSTFELEIFELLRTKNYFTAFLYLFLSVFLGFIGVVCGIWLAKRFYS